MTKIIWIRRTGDLILMFKSIVMDNLVTKIIHSKVEENFVSSINLLKGHHVNLRDIEQKEQHALKKSVNEENSSEFILFIKNMVSIRCKMVLKAVLEKLGLHYVHLELGKVEITNNFSPKKLDELKA